MGDVEPVEGAVFKVDVCVVGTGPAGLTVAHELAESGRRVAVIERGPSSPPEGPVVEGVARGLPYPLQETRSYGAGGTARMWCVRTPGGDGYVRFRELDRVDVDGDPEVGSRPWPVSYDELMQWYQRARKISRLPPDPVEPAADVVASMTQGRVQPVLLEFSHKSVFVTELPEQLEKHPDVSFFYDSRVVALDPGDEAGRIAGVTFETGPDRRRCQVKATVTVLATGAVENARLLMLPTSRAALQGTGTGAGVGSAVGSRSGAAGVGAGFMEHLLFQAGFLVPTAGDLLERLPGDRLEHEQGRLVERRYVLGPELEQRYGLPRLTVKLVRVPVSRSLVVRAFGAASSSGVVAVRALRDAVRLRSWASLPRLVRAVVADLAAVARHARARFGRGSRRLRLSPGDDVLLMVAVAEQRRDIGSHVVLDGEDRDGQPAARVAWHLGKEDRVALYDAVHALASELSSAGVGRFHPFFQRGKLPPDLGWGHHHMGTTVMSDALEDGVVDADLRVHGTENLYVVGSSVFPSAGHANPTLTVIALSCRLADHLGRVIAS